MKIYNLEERLEFLKEVAILEYDEWAFDKENSREERISNKINKIKKMFGQKDFCKLILIEGDTLIGFVSIFPNDSKEEPNLGPWYATMYVKKEYRGKGYSRILNDAILLEAKNRGFDLLYLKTNLDNYYEKFGAKFIKKLSSGEKLYTIKRD